MERGRDKNEPSGNKTGPDWIRIKVNPTDLRISPLKKSNQIAPNQSESNQIPVNQTKRRPRPPCAGQLPAHSTLFARGTAHQFRLPTSAHLLHPQPPSCPIVPNRGEGSQPVLIGCWFLNVPLRHSASRVLSCRALRRRIDVRCSLKHLLHSHP